MRDARTAGRPGVQSHTTQRSGAVLITMDNLDAVKTWLAFNAILVNDSRDIEAKFLLINHVLGNAVDGTC